MSVEKIQLLHEDYIRLTERFKALWTFHQFLRGVHKAFFSGEPEYEADFNSLYADMRAAAAKIDTSQPETVAPRLKEISARLDAIASTLREFDRKLSPSYVRRFFERVRPQDEKIAIHLLRFYFSQPEVDEDVIDKVDFLATVAATGVSDPEATTAKPRPAVRRIFESLGSTSVWPRVENAMAPGIARAFDELARDMQKAREFEDLLAQQLLDNVRTMKRRVASGLSHPEILAAVAHCNLTTRSIFHTLWEREERKLDEATGRIAELERELTRGGSEGHSPDEFRRFRELRLQYDRQTSERVLRARQVLELKGAITDVLEKFDISGLEARDIDQALELVEEADAEGSEEEFWREVSARILAPVEHYDDGSGALKTDLPGLAHLSLEPAELHAARRAVREGGVPPLAWHRVLLRAAGLRGKAEEELDLLRAARAAREGIGSAVRAARATLARAPGLDADLAALIEESEAANPEHDLRSWTRSRFRLLKATSELWLELDRSEES
ncbi:MAG TPA: hypothetical protein VIB08_02400 [Thermoanaerobaculia bacterium]|jgi:hypothetical protein